MKGRAATAFVGVLFAGVLAAASCTTFSAGDDGPDGGADGAACSPPACGGAGGRCGSVDACGLTFSCGECAPPYTCMTGTCQCAGRDACKERGATCGAVDDGCGKPRTCGGCEAGTTCQSADGGLACASGVCTSEAKDVTCKGTCNNATNNCGDVVACGDCTGGELCGADGARPGVCSCPPRTSAINQYYDASARRFCYTQTNQCPGVTGNVPIARIYSTATQGLVTLYRCRHVISATASNYFLTTSPTCDGLAGYTREGPIGACSPNAVCGSRLLYRYYRPGDSGDWLHSLSPTSPIVNYEPFGTVCHVWAP